ncbi:MAG: helix-turn-helix domain-containing protein, partial [Gammaproteobacteria bacterium]|nr:helix-turn-helix domain-containing protein [Gammaproteobacteria bacterium]
MDSVLLVGLRAQRKKAGVSKEQLSEMSGVSVNTIYLIEEACKATTKDIANALSKALALTSYHVLTNDGVKRTDIEDTDTLGTPETVGTVLCILAAPILIIGFILKLIVDIFSEKPESLAERALYDLTPGVGAYSLMTAAVVFATGVTIMLIAKAWEQRHTMTWSLY